MNIRSLLHRSARTMLNWRRWTKNTEMPSQETRKLRTGKELTQGSAPEFAYNRSYIYPKEYKPYTINSPSDLPLILTLCALLYAILRYNKQYLKRRGLTEREDMPHYKQ